MSKISYTSFVVIILFFSLTLTTLMSTPASGIKSEYNTTAPFFPQTTTKLTGEIGVNTDTYPEPLLSEGTYVGPLTGGAAPSSILGYHNLSEVNAKLNNIAQSHSTIAKVYDLGKLYPWPNGTPKRTVQNRTLYALKVSDNPGSNDSAEPDILYMSLHHAREWITVEVVIYVLEYIINNYQTNSTIANIVNNTELWFVPVVNPDGFNYSQYGRDDINNTNSNQWRKNLNETNGSPGFQDYNWARGDGVDLNRNYGYKWGYDNSGSSGNPDNQLYRGSAGFSEVETQIIRDFSLAKQFRLAISYHSYSQLILFPWAYDNFDTPHDTLFNEIAKNMSQYNNYQYGNAKDGVIYNCNGEANDWLYRNLTCLAFCFELGTLFIPPPNQILPICQKNLEPSLLIAKIADDPYKIFNSGISGRVTSTRGEPIEGVNITTTFATDIFSAMTNSTGHYELRLPPSSFGLHAEKDGYWLRSLNDITVQENKFTIKDFTMIDSQPPVVSDVWAETNGEPGKVFNIGSTVRLNVAELFAEANLTGIVEITSENQSYSSGEKALIFENSTGHYYYLWNTSKLLPWNDYVVEADLSDFDFNVDANGSNDTGPDLIIGLVDRTAPVISTVDSLDLNSGVPADSDEHYELGTNVRILMHELFHEKWLNGTGRIVSANASYDSGSVELNFEEQDNYYYFDWSTEGLIPADDYNIETTLRDLWGNIDTDGLLSYPDLTVTLEDTTPPVITRVDTRVGADDDELYELGSEVMIILEVAEFEAGLTGYVSISSNSMGYDISLNDLKYKSNNEYFYVYWDTNGLQVASDYVIESAMADKYMNYDSDGSKNFAADLIVKLVDTTPPEVSLVYSFVGSDQDNNYELGSSVWLVVEEVNDELNLEGNLRVYSETLKYDSGFQNLVYNATLEGYLWVWNTSDTSIDVASDYEVETTLSDRFGNVDSDGLAAGPDLIITIEDTTPPEISAVWSMVDFDNDNHYEAGSTVELVVEERFSEPAMAGTIYIASPKTKYNSGMQELAWDAANRYYTFTWLTFGLKPSDDYYIETTLIDRRGNADSDGLPITPDLIIRLVDTTPPKPVTDLEATQEASDITKVHLIWNNTEPDSKLHIYRTTVPISNITDLEPLITITGNQITDTLPSEPGTYYYIILIEDSSGNLNSKITPSNTAKATIPGPQPYIDPKAQVEEGTDSLWLWLTLILGVIIILAIISILYFIYPKNNENEDMAAQSQEPPVQTPNQDSETLSEQPELETQDFH